MRPIYFDCFSWKATGFLFLVSLVPTLLFSCASPSPNLLADRYHSIHIPVVKNETLEFALEERLTSELIHAFERDGRLRAASKQHADLELLAKITHVHLVPIAYSDLDRAIGYNMTISLEIDVIENSTGDRIVENKSFQAFGAFLVNSNPTSTSTQSVTEHLSEQIISFLIEGW